MDITISQGKKNLLKTVSVVLISGEPVQIKIDPDVIIQFSFIEEKNEKQSMSFSIEEGRLIITLLNFSNPLGSSTRKPIEIGTLEGKKLYMHFIVHVIGNDNDKTRLLNCSFFTENVID